MIHESAFVEEDVKLGEGTNVWHFVHIRKKAKIGKNCNIGKGVYIDLGVLVGDNCKIQNFATLYQGLKVGNDVFIGPHVCFTNDIFPRAILWSDEKLVDTIVDDGASLGANSTIIAGVKIGKHSLIGAGSVVTKDVPDYGIVYGNPARLKGFICKCSEKLKKVSRKDDIIIFNCLSCGSEIMIDSNTCDEVDR